MNDYSTKLSILTQMAMPHLGEIIAALGVKLFARGYYWGGPCPIHGGDNPTALTLFMDGEEVAGNWQCWTHACHKPFKKSLLGFIHGVISRQKYDWCGPDSKRAPFREALDWLCDFLQVPFDSITTGNEDVSKRLFVSQARAYTRGQAAPPRGWPQEEVRTRLRIPGEYFLARGYSPATLDLYDVGSPLDNRPHSPMRDRVVVPIYDQDYRRVIGFTGRSIYRECPQCGLYHSPRDDCPQTQEDRQDACKWRNSSGFARQSVLYSYWFARKRIRACSTVILVEGPGDVWRVREAGIDNVVALLGAALTDEQQCILEASGATHVVGAFDADEAGAHCMLSLRENLARGFRLSEVRMPVGRHDLGECAVDEVKGLLGRYS